MDSSEANWRAVNQYAVRLSGLDQELQKQIDARFYKEILPWSQKLSLWGKACVLALELLHPDQIPSSPMQKLQTLKQILSDLQKNETEISVAVGVPERLISRALKSAANFDCYALVPLSISGDDSNMAVPVQGSYCLDNIVDSNLDSFYRSSRPLMKGDTIMVVLPEVFEVNQIDVRMGNKEAPTSFIYNGMLEYSVDMKEWKSLGTVIYPEISWKKEAAVQAKAVRIVVLKDQKQGLTMRYFSVKVVNSPRLEVSLNLED